ncbi:putative polyketide synthase module [Monocercomonoides exilis]|uniref:putative polyketide synthase module n=1 Tax=Monocercomonoides exilis TaxID=2049356 RepID=UPI00355A8A14|nr:putative polyketide synthase module [Monocercomonoides exilis]|eukprot:MONOS_9060.1-p1 / transcript=MONOS_9060.1 / gene=MONOS_9060 / organism=Monocercomonoides_exilis_PA203 / gene_product=polyketide synthase module / transcript_product=polyketide synthase module / location=Mono_scaffold00361:8209-18789(-) / protein_length=3526 / sequence_SO=supercontig / SO=protein_coding / is_pseudo=false
MSSDELLGPQDPVAVVGLGARLPGGANSPEQFWKLLLEGYDGISDIPKERWDGAYFHDPENLGLVGKSIQNKGGFLKGYNIDEIDLKFFYLSPREAKTLDPNQRLLLEVTYETFENAGVPLEHISGSRTGVFVGISATDYSHLQFPDINTIDVHTQTGVSTSINANRLSYFYNLIGPSFIVDTACSSTLVALNCACQSMRTRECDSALCGAVNLMMYPEISIGFSKLGVLSPDGHCKAFDAKANGYVRSEGCGMVLLKRLSDAERDGNRIYAVIRGTHVGSDGHYQQQMTSPSEQQQAVVLREILKKSSIQSADVGYVESHGTGTFVGDPIECRSVSSVLNIGRKDDEHILIGSVKSNVGHLEPAAGIVSIIKVSMCLKEKMIPATISVKKPNPNIDMQKLNLKIVTSHMKYPEGRNGMPRTAVISAFGFGGTNGGCVMQEYTGNKGLKDVPSGLKEIEREELFILSARSVDALKGYAKKLAEFMSSHSCPPIQHIAYTLGCHRTQHKQCRLAFIARSKEEAVKELNAFVNDEKDTGAVQTRFTSMMPSEKKRKLCLVYCGQGSQWFGMGRALYRENVVFREWMDRIDNCLKEAGADYSIVEEIITGTEETSHVDQVEYLQPIFFAIQVCVYKVMEAAGLKPDAVVGHSLGEIAAAHVSGALSIEDATKVAWERAKGQKFCNGMGHMAAVTGEYADLKRLIEGRGVDIAGHNAPTRWNISGETAGMDEVERIATEGEETPVRVRRLLVDEPMHSQFVDLIHDQLVGGLKNIVPQRPTIPLISTYTPQQKDFKMDGKYWWASLRSPVQFMDAILEMVRRTSAESDAEEEEAEKEGEEEGEDNSHHDHRETEWVFLECGPHNVLRTFLGEIMGSEGKPFIYVPTLLRKAENERLLMLRTLANMFSLGYNLDLKNSVFIPYNTYYETKARVLFEESSLSTKEDVPQYYYVPNLPLYAWARTKCWNESPVQHEHRLGSSDNHPIARIRQDTLNPCWQSDISTSHIPWVVDHCLQGNIVVPGVTFVECILTCGRRVFGDRPFWLRNVHFKNAFYMNKGDVMRVNISLDPIYKEGSRSSTVDAYNVTLSSRVLPKGEYQVNCAVVIEAEDSIAEKEKAAVKKVPGLPPNFQISHPSQAFDDIDLDAFRKLCPIEIPTDQFFSQLWEDGLELRRQLRLCRKIWINDRNNPLMSIAYIEVNPETTEEELGRWGFMYPPFLDSCLQSGLSAREKRGAFFPVEAYRARFARSVPKTARHCWALSRKDPVTGRLSMTCCDDEGKVYGSLQDVLIRYLESGKRGTKLGMIGGTETPVFEHKWEYLSTIPAHGIEEETGDSPLPSPEDPAFVASCDDMMRKIGAEFHTQEMADVIIPLNNMLTNAIVLEVFRTKLNLWKQEAELIRSKKIDVSAIKAVPVKQLAESVNILPFYHRLFLLLCRYLSEAGYLALSLIPEAQQKAKSEPTFFIENYVAAPLAPFFHDETQPLPHNEDCEALTAEILSRFPQMRPSTMLMMDVGRKMKDVIVDGEKAVTLIFKDKGLADAVYRDDGEVRTFNYVAQGVLACLIKTMKEKEKKEGEATSDKPLKILEVGAGTGGTTAYLMELLDPLTTTYTYTDISASFFGTAKQRFARYASFMNFKTLNIEEQPIEQGFEPHSQDIIVAANVVHATTDLSVTLSHIQQLLKPGGHLILLEALNGLRWLDIVFGLTDGWWALQDKQFRQHPLLTPAMWTDILKRSGFESSHVFSEWKEFGTNGARMGRVGIPVAQTPKTSQKQKEELQASMNAKQEETLKKIQTEAPTTSAIVFAEERNVVSGAVISSLLRDGHYVIAALKQKTQLSSADFLKEICTKPVDHSKNHLLLSQNEISVLAANFHVMFVEEAATSRAGYDAIFKHITEASKPPVVSIVHGWSLDLPAMADTEKEIMQGFELNVYSPLYLVHTLSDVSKTSAVSSHITTWGVTQGVWTVDGASRPGTVGVGQATLWGLNRCILNELGSVHPRSIDLSLHPDQTELDSFISVIVSTAFDAKTKCNSVVSSSSQTAETSAVVPLYETEIAIRGNKCFAQRLIQHQHSDELHLINQIAPSSEGCYALTTPTNNKLILEERKRLDVIPAGEVEVHVAASGIVYRDIMMWSGRLPENARQGSNVGLEFAGVVSRVGEGVTNVAVGDRVFGVGRECASSYTVVHSTNIGKAPSTYSWDQLGGIGLELITAYYSLVTVGRMKKGDYVLIHAATGGVGMCALSLCRCFGAIPICTTRSEMKKRFLEYMGVKHIVSSEDTSFCEKARALTPNGRGVDIVLNSLPGQENIHAGLAALAKGGRFVEIGKVDLYGGTMISLQPFIGNVSYNVVAIDQKILDDDDQLGPIFEDCSKLLFEGTFIPPPITSYPLSQAEDAYNFFKEGKHIGKVVLSPVSLSFAPTAIPPVRSILPLSSQGSYILSDGTYLVTAGTAGFSFELAVGLLERGAKHLALSSRSGAGDINRQRQFEALRKKYGAEVRVFSCDSSSAEQTREMLAEIRRSMPPLRGLIHGAMLLHDGYMINLDHKAFFEVLGPKSLGAWLLHDDTVKHNDPIEQFIVLSSLNVVVGTHGQANYASANMFLDGLVQHRRAQGLPAMSVQWGVLGGVGYVHRNSSTLGANMSQFGFRAFSPQWANRMLHTCLEAQADIEEEHVGNLPAERALSAALAQQQADAFKSIPVGLLPASLRPENEASHPSHFFEGAHNRNNIVAARKVFRFPSSVPTSVGVFNVSWEPLFEFMSALPETGRFKYIKQELEKDLQMSGKKKKSGGSEGLSVTEKGLAGLMDDGADSTGAGESSLDESLTVSEKLKTITSEEEAIAFLSRAIAAQSAQVLGISSSETISLDVPLSQYGLDSLTAVEMKNWTEKQVKVDIPVVDFVRGPSSDQLAHSMLTKFYESYGRPKASAAQAEASDSSKAATSSHPSASASSASASAASSASSSAFDSASGGATISVDKDAPVLEEKEEEKPKRKSPLTAYVFTGQSGLKTGVGMDLYDAYPEAREIWDKCDAHFMDQLGVSLLKIIRENPVSYKVDFTDGERGKELRKKFMNLRVTDDDEVMKEVHAIDPTIDARAFPTVNEDTAHYTFYSPNGLLNMTHFAQPIIIIYEYVALAILNAQKEKSGGKDSKHKVNHLFCGHSLGEYCALTAVGGIAPAHEMAMVCFIRGMVMQTCVPRDRITHMTDYGMAAVSPLRVASWFKIEHLRKVMECTINACGGRLLQIVNYNVYNDQYVVSGERYAIWQLGLALTHVEEESRKRLDNPKSKLSGEALADSVLADIETVCYEHIFQHPFTQTPLEVPRTTSVMPLKGIDMPFHSRLLRKVVPLFRSFLDSRLPTVDKFDYAGTLVGRFITNTYSKEVFSLNLPYVRQILAVTGSPYLRDAMGQLVDESMNEMVMRYEMNAAVKKEGEAAKQRFPQWLSMTPNERCRLILRESLSYQFASPVQWIDAQNTLMGSKIKRVVEIGPSKTLSTMFSKSILKAKASAEGDRKALIKELDQISVFTFSTDKDALMKMAEEETE